VTVEIDRLAAVIRPRTPWEALDLGFALGRRWFPRLLGLWWLAALPLALLGAFWLGSSPSLWALLVWWFKPLYEAPLLFWLGRRLFGDTPGLRDLWGARRQMLPARLLPYLLWRRLTPSRSFQMPLLLLEGLGGRERRRRQQVLRGPGGTAAWLTVIGVHFESILWVSAMLLIAIMIPEELPGLDLSAAFLDEDSAPYWLSTLLYLVAMSVIAPFYVAAGFALYLARRTELEAWDLELAFRRFAPSRRRRPGGPAGPGIAALAPLALGVMLAMPDPAQALELSPGQARARIEAVLAGEDFGRTREVPTWVYVGSGSSADEASERPAWLVDLLGTLGQWAELGAVVLKWLIYLAAGVLLLAVLRRILQAPARRPRGASPPGWGVSAPGARPPMQAAQIPEDVAAAARALLAGGDARAALALLYGASIALLRGGHGLEVPESATESECLAMVLARCPPRERALMRRLVRLWQRLAYGHQEPPPADIEGLLEDWRLWEAGSVGR
jgi:hypothetical protein